MNHSNFDELDMNNFFKNFRCFGIVKTIYFNFRYLPFRDAVNLPFILASNVRVSSCHRGFCEFIGGG
jgi:hypothetical protein